MKAVRLIVLASLVLVVPAAAADSFTLTVVSQTSTTITFSYPQQPGYGYLYSANGTVVSRTNNPAVTQVRFAKASSYEVAAIVKGTTGAYPTTPPPAAVCADGVDNDADGKIDYPSDPGCTSATDADETDSVLPPPTTISSATCASRASVAGAVIANVTVTGGCSVSGPNVTLDHVTVQGVVAVGNGTKLTNSTARGFSAFGADNWLVQGNVLDGQGLVDNNIWWDAGGNVPDHWVIRNNTIRNFYDAANPSNHSEGLYIGYSTDGLVEGNTFTNNGNTGHIFFTWFGSTANPSTSYPRNICVRGNTFGPTHGAYVDINFRSEIPTSSGIRIQSNATSTSPQFYGAC